MKLRRLHWVLLGAGALVAALVGWFWLIQTAASSGLASGVAGSLAEVSAVQQHVLASGYVEAASVQLGQNMGPSGSTRYLNVNTIWRGEPESPAAAAVTVAGLVLESHPRIDDLDRVTIGIGKQVRFGPFFHFNQNQAFSRSPAEWEALVARGPGRPKVVPAPEIGAVVLENALLTAGPAQAATCPTRRAGRQFGRDGLQLRVAGRCDDATGALIGQSFAGVTIPDGEVSVEVRVSDGLERAAVRLWTRFTPNASGYFALLEPGRGRAALYRWSGGQQFTLLAERSVEPGQLPNPDGWTSVAVRARAARLWLLLNGRPILSGRDASYDTGGTNVALQRSGNPDDAYETAVVVRNLRVSALASGEPERLPTYQPPQPAPRR